MSFAKLFLAASLLAAPTAFAKDNNNNAAKGATISSPVVVNAPEGGYHGKGSNPTSSDDEGYGSAKGSDASPSQQGRGADDSTYYMPDNEYQNDPSYFSGGYVQGYTDLSGQTRINKDRDVQLGLRYAAGKGLESSPDLVGGSIYGRAFHPSKRYAAELSFDSLSSDPSAGVHMKQGSLLLSYALFLNPDGNLKPYGSMGIGGTWHGVAGDQSAYGAIAFGVGLDIAIGEKVSINIDGRLIGDSETNEEVRINATNLNVPQEFVVSSAGLSFRF